MLFSFHAIKPTVDHTAMFHLGHVLGHSLCCLWCILATGDAVYMDNEQSLAEYVLSQDGIIFRGSYKYPISTPWNFGQVPTPTATLSASLHLALTLSWTRGTLCQSGVHYAYSDNRKYPQVIYDILQNCKYAVISEHLTLEWTEIFMSDNGQSGSDKVSCLWNPIQLAWH